MTSVRYLVRLSALLALICGSANCLPAQSQITTATIEGRVFDESKAVLPRAHILVTHVDTGATRTVFTDESGLYVVPLLPVGEYELTTQLSGFTTVKRLGIQLTLGQTQEVDVTLKIASVDQSVEVSDSPPLIDVSRSETSRLVDKIQISSLPINGRRFLDLAFLTPGVYQERERNNLSLSGSRGINNNVNVDGADFNQPFFGGQRGGERSSQSYVISQEAIQEFQIVRAGFSAEFGRSTGGILNVITKSGSNTLHGSLFYFLRHREFSPRDLNGDDRAPIRQQYGASVGGPILRNKTFFFTVFDQQQEHQPLIVRFNTVAGLPQDLLDEQGTFQSTNNVSTYLVKVDHELSSSLHVSGRYNYSRNRAENGTFTGVSSGTINNNGSERDRTHTGVVSINKIFTPSLLNELRGQYSYEERPRTNNGEDSDFVSKVGPQVQITGCCFFGGVSFLPVQQYDSRLQFTDNVSVIHRSHTLKLGFDYDRSYTDQVFRGNWRGVYIFNNIASFLRVQNHALNPSTNQPYSADQLRLFFGSGEFRSSVNEFSGYLQDSLKLSRKIALSLGLRYEAALMPQPTHPNAALPETASVPSSRAMWQPRLGFSYDLRGNGRTVIKLGGGYFYARTPMLLVNQAFNSNGDPAVGVTFTLNSAQIAAVQRMHPEFIFPFVPETSRAEDSSYITGTGVNGLRPDASFFAPDFHNPRSLQYTGSVEQQVGEHLILAAEYVHNNTVYLERIRDVNLPIPMYQLDNSVPPVVRPRFSAPRPNDKFSVLRSQESSARSNYDALTFSVNRRYAKRVQVSAHYTLSYNRDDDSNERNFAGITYENAFNLREEYRWSRNDVRHRSVLSGMLDLPLRFQIGSIIEWRSGSPFSAFTGTDSNGDGQFTDKPILNGRPLLRNAFRQPNFFNHDLRITKTFRIREGHHLSLIWEMFNLWNLEDLSFNVSSNESTTTALGSLWGRGQLPLPTFRTFYLPDGTLNKGGVTVGAPFQLQVALKYTF